jgi:hypothetical protein
MSDAAGTPNTKKCVWESAANAHVKYSGNPVSDPKTYKPALGTLTYTDRLDIARVSIDDGLTAQILDFYV